MGDEDAEKAIAAFNGKDIGGRALTVNEARPMVKKEFTRPGRTIQPLVSNRVSEHSFKSAARQQESILAPLEKKNSCSGSRSRMPAWVNSDHLTTARFPWHGFGGRLLCARQMQLRSRLSRLSCAWLSTGLATVWMGRSPAYRNRQRPRYGFYVDHIVDSFGACS